MNILKCVAALTLVSSTAFADHTGRGDPAQIARASYRSATDAETLGRDAQFSCSGWGSRLAYSADRLHHALSDLYRAARRSGPVPPDHREDEIVDLFESAESAYYQVESDYRNSWCDGQVQRDYLNLQNGFTRLEQTIQ